MRYNARLEAKARSSVEDLRRALAIGMSAAEYDEKLKRDRKAAAEARVARDVSRRAGMDWAALEADDMCDHDDDYGTLIDPDTVADALRAAKQAGVDEERARCIAVLREAASE